MAQEVILPRQGQSVESCIILEWKKSEGDSVAEGDILCEVETDKASFEVESTASGVLLKQLAAEGDDVPVLSALAVVGESGEDISEYTSGSASGGTEKQSEATTSPETASGHDEEETAPANDTPVGDAGSADRSESMAPAGAKIDRNGEAFVSPRARNIAAAKAIDLSSVAGTGPGGRIIERDVLAALGTRNPLSPAAIEEMVATGKSAPAVGTGPGGRIVTRDLTKTSAAPAGATAPSKDTPALDFPGPIETIELKGVRKVIAERMHASLLESAQLTMNSAADARAILAYRKKVKAADESLDLGSITLNDLILYAVVRTLLRYPEMNASMSDGTITRYANVHLGFAVDTPRGLLVPVIRNAHSLSLRQLGAESSRLAEACMAGKAGPDELSGGTFTVTNLGNLGVTDFTPVLNTPQVGILGVGSIEPKPVLTDGEYEFIPHIGLSLTIDHRAVDGAPGARFMKDVANLIANIDLALAG